MAGVVKNLPEMQETRVWRIVQYDMGGQKGKSGRAKASKISID